MAKTQSTNAVVANALNACGAARNAEADEPLWQKYHNLVREATVIIRDAVSIAQKIEKMGIPASSKSAGRLWRELSRVQGKLRDELY